MEFPDAHLDEPLAATMPLIVEPPTILQLGEWMRDRAWIDMRTPRGKVQRVQIIQLTIHFHGEEIEVEQRWYGVDERIRRKRFWFNAEDCWDCRPTEVGLLDVEPLEGRAVQPDMPPPKPKARDDIDEATQAVIDEIIVGAVDFGQVAMTDLVGTCADYRVIHYKHAAIIVTYEMTDVPPVTICKKVYGYHSVQPFLTASYKARHQDDGERKGFRKCCQEIAARVKVKPVRVRPFPKDYHPVLSK